MFLTAHVSELQTLTTNTHTPTPHTLKRVTDTLHLLLYLAYQT